MGKLQSTFQKLLHVHQRHLEHMRPERLTKFLPRQVVFNFTSFLPLTVRRPRRRGGGEGGGALFSKRSPLRSHLWCERNFPGPALPGGEREGGEEEEEKEEGGSKAPTRCQVSGLAHAFSSPRVRPRSRGAVAPPHGAPGPLPESSHTAAGGGLEGWRMHGWMHG